MSYLLGEEADLSWDVEVDDVDEEPTTFTVVVTKPSGQTDQLTPNNPTPGHYEATYLFPAAGHYRWDALAEGAVVAAASGVFDVWDPAAETAPLTGLAAPWSDAAALSRRPEIKNYNDDNPSSPIPQSILNDALRFASEILYALSGRQFTGLARTYVRPVARPGGWDARSWASASLGYWQSWGSNYSSTGYGSVVGRALGRRDCPDEIALNYPIMRIETVTIDGVTIPADEYRVDDHRLLVRTRVSASSAPTERGGWPRTQTLDLPDTEPGTFAVTYWYGVGPPQSGVTACEVFAAELALDMIGADNRLPARIRELSRQGETIAVVDSLDALTKGWTGIPICDYFIASLNPGRLVRRGAVWSPDMERVRTPST